MFLHYVLEIMKKFRKTLLFSWLGKTTSCWEELWIALPVVTQCGHSEYMFIDYFFISFIWYYVIFQKMSKNFFELKNYFQIISIKINEIYLCVNWNEFITSALVTFSFLCQIMKSAKMLENRWKIRVFDPSNKKEIIIIILLN